MYKVSLTLDIMVCHLRILVSALMVAGPFSILELLRNPRRFVRISLLLISRYCQRISWPRDYRIYVAKAYIID